MIIFILIITQLLFTASDLLGRYYMVKFGFNVANFLSPWFVAYWLLKIIGIFGQLYVFTATKLGKTMALFAAVSIILSNVLGYLLLHEILTTREYIGVMLAILTFLILAFWK